MEKGKIKRNDEKNVKKMRKGKGKTKRTKMKKKKLESKQKNDNLINIQKQYPMRSQKTKITLVFKQKRLKTKMLDVVAI